MYDWILQYGYRPVIIATKLDKINRSQIQKQVKLLRDGLGAGTETAVIPFSALTRQGREEIYAMLEELLGQGEPQDEGTL